MPTVATDARVSRQVTRTCPRLVPDAAGASDPGARRAHGAMLAKPRLCLATDSLEPSGVGEHMLALATETGVSRYDVDPGLPGERLAAGRSAAPRRPPRGSRVKRLDDDHEADGRNGWRGRRLRRSCMSTPGSAGRGTALAVPWGVQAGVGALVRTEHLPDLVTDPRPRHGIRRPGLARVDRVICVSAAAAATFPGRGHRAPPEAMPSSATACRCARPGDLATRDAVRAWDSTLPRHCPVALVTTARLHAPEGPRHAHRALMPSDPRPPSRVLPHAGWHRKRARCRRHMLRAQP